MINYLIKNDINEIKLINKLIIFIVNKAVGDISTQGKHSYQGMQVNDLLLIIADPSPF